MPLASGQSLAIKAHVNSGETGLSNRKWSYRWGGVKGGRDRLKKKTEVGGCQRGAEGLFYNLVKTLYCYGGEENNRGTV